MFDVAVNLNFFCFLDEKNVTARQRPHTFSSIFLESLILAQD